MNFTISEQVLSDGSRVFNVILFADHDDTYVGPPQRIEVKCCSKRDAVLFVQELGVLVEKHTIESLNDL